MKKKLLLFVILIVNLLFNYVSAENTKNLEFVMQIEKVHNSLYNKLEFLDSRLDSTDYGVVKTGALDSKSKVVIRENLSTRLQNLLQKTIDSTAQPGVMLFQLRHLKFAEISGSFSQAGFCSFGANLYEKVGDKYKKIAEIDTIVLVKKFDVTSSLLKTGGKVVYEFFRENLCKKSTDTVSYSYNHVQVIDYFDKQKIKLYTTEKYDDGVYYTYQSFCEQKPDDKAFVKQENGKILSVKIRDKKNKLVKIKSENVYAIVDNGKPYIATNCGFYPLIKSNDDFYFKGKIRETGVKNGDVYVFISLYFGAAGGLFVGIAGLNDGNSDTYIMQINYKTGYPIKMKKLSN